MPGFRRVAMRILLICTALTAGLFLSQAARAEAPSDFQRERQAMVERQIASRGVKDTRVLAAMARVPRHLFVPEGLRGSAYEDYPLPIGEGQTISQPYIVAFMTEALEIAAQDRVLEIGTGSGYQAAILGEIVKEVYTIEIIESLAARAQETLTRMGYRNIFVKAGNGYLGWPEKAPFDAIIVTCAPDRIPQALIDQLKEGGRMISPVGKAGSVQKLVRVVKKGGRVEQKDVMAVRFVPMVGGGR
jgi:protein-L-isoaspartate(D-aspartate) O-methyltransferase